MSEQKTPRTDSATITNLGKILERKENASYVPVEFARTLERSNAELLEALEALITVNPAFRTKNIGAPNSFARMNQELQIKAEDNAKAAIAKAKGEV